MERDRAKLDRPVGTAGTPRPRPPASARRHCQSENFTRLSAYLGACLPGMCDPVTMSVSVEESARAFQERALRARAARERHALEVRAKVEQQVKLLLPPGARAWLIGSLAWGGFGERSDVDLVLAGATECEATLLEDAVSRASGVEVDVLQLDELPAPFRRRVELEGAPLHGR